MPDITVRVLQTDGKLSEILVPGAVAMSIETPGPMAVAILDPTYDDHPAPAWWVTAVPGQVKVQAKAAGTVVYEDPAGLRKWRDVGPLDSSGKPYLMDFYGWEGGMVRVLRNTGTFKTGLWVRLADVEPR